MYKKKRERENEEMGANDISVLRTWTSRQDRSNGASSFAGMRFNGSRDAKFRNAVRYTACSTFSIKFARVYRGLGVVESSARWAFSANGNERKEGLHVPADSTRFRVLGDEIDGEGRESIDERLFVTLDSPSKIRRTGEL